MAELILLRGQRALVDDEDLPKVAGFRWFVGTKGYVMAWVPEEKTCVYLHRVILGVEEHGHSTEVDRRHHNRLDNRKAELRIVTQHQQRGNSRGLLSRSKASVFKGVTWHRKNQKWQAGIKIMTNGQKRYHYLGCFDAEADAARAYNTAARGYFGADFAFLNTV